MCVFFSLSLKVKDYLSGVSENLPHFKLWQEDLKLIEGTNLLKTKIYKNLLQIAKK